MSQIDTVNKNALGVCCVSFPSFFFLYFLCYFSESKLNDADFFPKRVQRVFLLCTSIFLGDYTSHNFLKTKDKTKEGRGKATIACCEK